MGVRAKFKVTKVEAQTHRRANGEQIESTEMRTIVLSPVYGNGDPAHENTKFWQYTPSGEIRLGTINPTAWEQFELDAEYYIDFTRAE